MERLQFDDVEVTFRLTERTDAERIVSVHGSAFASWYEPLFEQLTEPSVLWYQRRLRKADTDTGPYRPLTTTEDAAICTRLMEHVGWPTAHAVGHSYGALVVLQ